MLNMALPIIYLLLIFILKKLYDYGLITLAKKVLIEVIDFITDWRTFVSFMIVWMFTNGWAYAFMIIGPRFNIQWMSIVGYAYMGFLWMPFTPEKVVTIPLTIYLKGKLFPKNKELKTIQNKGVLKKYAQS